MLGPSGSAHQIDRLLVFGALLADYRLISRPWLWVLKILGTLRASVRAILAHIRGAKFQIAPGYLTL